MNKIFLYALSIILVNTLMFQDQKINIWLCGDSTMSIKEVGAYPETGWGMPFASFWDTTSTKIINKAKNGRSTKTFISEGLWQSVYDNMKEGDWVLIQFGHNDESKEKTERYTTIDEYKSNLARFINDTRQKKGIPVLLTPVGRRKFDKEGHVLETHKGYSEAMMSLADSMHVGIINMDLHSRTLYQQYGDSTSRLLFLQLKAGEHPNYPNGKEDNTHFSELGARLIAQIVLNQLASKYPELKNHVVKSTRK